MSDSDSKSRGVTLGLAASVLGPLSAALHEVGLFSLGPPATLWPVFNVALTALAGLLIQGRALARTAIWIRALLTAPNLLVLALYGFFVLFFGLGGSR